MAGTCNSVRCLPTSALSRAEVTGDFGGSTSSSLAAFARAKYFAINVLTADQRELSQRLSSTASGHGGIPLINGCAFDRANVRDGSKLCENVFPPQKTARNRERSASTRRSEQIFALSSPESTRAQARGTLTDP